MGRSGVNFGTIGKLTNGETSFSNVSLRSKRSPRCRLKILMESEKVDCTHLIGMRQYGSL